MLKIILLIWLLFVPFFAESLLVSELSYKGKFSPGDFRRIKISLTNEKTVPEQVHFKLVDYACNAEGEHFFKKPHSFERSNASWIHLHTNQLTLKAKEKADYFFTVKVPSDPLLQGSYWSVILIEPKDPVNTIKDQLMGFNLAIQLRFAYHLITTIDEGVAKLEVIQTKLYPLQEEEKLGIDIKNTGTLFLNPKATLKLYNSAGVLEKTLISQKERLYPASSQRYFFQGMGLKGKKYTAFLLLDNEDKHLFGETFELSLE